MLIAHISDFHVFHDRAETPLVRPDAARAARRVVEDMAQFSPGFDAVAFTGDLTDGGSTEDYDLLRDVLSPLKIPVFVVPGNHDRRATLRSAFGGDIPFEDGHFLNYENHLGFLRILALDTLIEGRSEGALAPESLHWLAGKLASPALAPILLLLHHPPFPTGIDALDRSALTGGREEMAEMIRAYQSPLIILAGHIHRPFQAIWNGAYCAVAGSPAFQIALDLAASEHGPGRVSEPYAYYVYRIDETGGFTVHTRFVALD
ncbi:metallophosphoesterase [Ensifer sp. YR511]|uniref:metallophosphoesterase n=1 Tax=Ensifer sp. YR511 TaxID=1855294 RepID=UPI00087F2B0B|nr:metallophosphoesterase [Ensifer sp. YR511]SDN02203.1 Calcineurin-like phosphoesterase [Ensifer sp. YR511]